MPDLLRQMTPPGQQKHRHDGHMGPAEVQEFCPLDDEGVNVMRVAVKQSDVGARANHRVLKMRGRFPIWRARRRYKRHIWPRNLM